MCLFVHKASLAVKKKNKCETNIWMSLNKYDKIKSDKTQATNNFVITFSSLGWHLMA